MDDRTDRVIAALAEIGGKARPSARAGHVRISRSIHPREARKAIAVAHGRMPNAGRTTAEWAAAILARETDLANRERLRQWFTSHGVAVAA